VAEPGRAETIYRGEIANKPKRLEKLLTTLSADYDGGCCRSAMKRVRAATCPTAGFWSAAARAAGERVAQLTDHLMCALPEWSLAPVVDS
jgi:hypothetical protein